MKDFHKFDYSLIEDCDTWYIDTLIDLEDRKSLLSKLEGSSNRREDGKKVMLEFLKEMWEKRKENPELKKKVLACIDTQKKKLKELLKNYNSIAIVSHS